MDVEEALKKLGLFGKWQVLWYTVLTLSCLFPAAWHTVSIVWIGYKPPHHCKLPDNTSEIDKWIPRQDDSKLSSCSMYINSSVNNDTMDCPNGWVYDESISGPNIVTKWDMVCHKSYLLDTAQSTLTFGILLGALIFTKLSDSFGRKPIFIITNLFISIIGVLSVLPSKLELYYALRFLLGTFQQGSLLCYLVYISEIFSSKDRHLIVIMACAIWGLASSILPLIAYLTKDWIKFQLIISIYGFLFIPFYWKLSESVPWLYANNRLKDAEETLLKAAKMNKISFIQPILHVNEKLNDSILSNDSAKLKRKFLKVKIKCSNKKQEVSTESFQYSTLDLFKSRILFKHLVLCLIFGFVVNLGYYGLTLTSNSLSGNHYLNGFLNSFIEIPACLITFFFVNRYGRKRPFALLQVLEGVSLLSIVLMRLIGEKNGVNNDILTALAIIGKFCASGAFSIVFLFVTEMFPTNLRNQAVGICFFFSRFGVVLASYSSLALETYPNLLTALFGSLAIMVAICLLFLPETHNKALPETIKEIEAWYKKPTLREEANISQEELRL